jgi:hypothetical protein
LPVPIGGGDIDLDRDRIICEIAEALSELSGEDILPLELLEYQRDKKQPLSDDRGKELEIRHL